MRNPPCSWRRCRPLRCSQTSIVPWSMKTFQGKVVDKDREIKRKEVPANGRELAVDDSDDKDREERGGQER